MAGLGELLIFAMVDRLHLNHQLGKSLILITTRVSDTLAIHALSRSLLDHGDFKRRTAASTCNARPLVDPRHSFWTGLANKTGDHQIPRESLRRALGQTRAAVLQEPGP